MGCTRGHPLWSDRNSAAERPGPRGLPALRARARRRASYQSHRGITAMERRRKTAPRITESRLDPTAYDASPFAISMYPNIDEFTDHGQIVIHKIAVAQVGDPGASNPAQTGESVGVRA